MNSMVEHGSPV
jgi:hypothetical protein